MVTPDLLRNTFAIERRCDAQNTEKIFVCKDCLIGFTNEGSETPLLNHLLSDQHQRAANEEGCIPEENMPKTIRELATRNVIVEVPGQALVVCIYCAVVIDRNVSKVKIHINSRKHTDRVSRIPDKVLNAVHRVFKEEEATDKMMKSTNGTIIVVSRDEKGGKVHCRLCQSDFNVYFWKHGTEMANHLTSALHVRLQTFWKTNCSEEQPEMVQDLEKEKRIDDVLEREAAKNVVQFVEEGRRYHCTLCHKDLEKSEFEVANHLKKSYHKDLVPNLNNVNRNDFFYDVVNLFVARKSTKIKKKQKINFQNPPCMEKTYQTCPQQFSHLLFFVLDVTTCGSLSNSIYRWSDFRQSCADETYNVEIKSLCLFSEILFVFIICVCCIFIYFIYLF